MNQADIVRKKQLACKQLAFFQSITGKQLALGTVTDDASIRSSIECLTLLRPFTAQGAKMVRIGGEADGGYVMPDPGRGGIAYSFGVSDCSPWDIEMAERDFKVYQYDGTISKGPYEHPNIFFNRFNVGPASCGEGMKSLQNILCDNGHEDHTDLILQIDIEGGEWDFFADMSERDMLRFRQIIVELHGVDAVPQRLEILRKIGRTHTPVHFHYNNDQLPVWIAPLEFFYNPHVLEISYVRAGDYAFSPCNRYFPTHLDRPNSPLLPDIPIGYFDLLLGKAAQ